jgi:hypothetical protein
LFTFPASYLLYCIIIYFIAYHIYFTYIHTLCLTTTRWSWGHKIRKLFCRLLKEERRVFFECSPRVRYKPRVSSWRKFTHATTLSTWSTNELAPFLVSSPGQFEFGKVPETLKIHKTGFSVLKSYNQNKGDRWKIPINQCKTWL